MIQWCEHSERVANNGKLTILITLHTFVLKHWAYVAAFQCNCEELNFRCLRGKPHFGQMLRVQQEAGPGLLNVVLLGCNLLLTRDTGCSCCSAHRTAPPTYQQTYVLLPAVKPEVRLLLFSTFIAMHAIKMKLKYSQLLYTNIFFWMTTS